MDEILRLIQLDDERMNSYDLLGLAKQSTTTATPAPTLVDPVEMPKQKSDIEEFFF